MCVCVCVYTRERPSEILSSLLREFLIQMCSGVIYSSTFKHIPIGRTAYTRAYNRSRVYVRLLHDALETDGDPEVDTFGRGGRRPYHERAGKVNSTTTTTSFIHKYIRRKNRGSWKMSRNVRRPCRRVLPGSCRESFTTIFVRNNAAAPRRLPNSFPYAFLCSSRLPDFRNDARDVIYTYGVPFILITAQVLREFDGQISFVPACT